MWSRSMWLRYIYTYIYSSINIHIITYVIYVRGSGDVVKEHVAQVQHYGSYVKYLINIVSVYIMYFVD